MKRDLSLWQLVGFAFTALGGTMLQFLYDWTNNNIVAAFSAVNESTWEHMKLLYFPLFFFSLLQSRFFKDFKSFWGVKLWGTTTGLVLIPVFFYTYNGAFGKSPDWFNIAIFFIAAAAALILEKHLFKQDGFHCKTPTLAFVLIFIIGILFVVFTYATPHLPLFQDPITGTFGLSY